MTESEQIIALKRGNTVLIESLMGMVNQFFYETQDGEYLYHRFMSAEEGAIDTLIDSGFAEVVEGKGYKLLWDKLEQRKKELKL